MIKVGEMSAVILTLAMLMATIGEAASDAWTVEAVDANARLVADWTTANPKPHDKLNWTYGAFYVGVTALGLSDPTAPYLEQIRALGREHAWGHLSRTYHADDHCIGQSWLELAAFDNNMTYAARLLQNYDYILANPHTGPLDFTKKDNQKRWSWCDALFMSPTVLVRAYGLTGDTRYLDFMDAEYKATTDYLYSKQDRLFFRDSRYFEQMTKNNKHKYWSRGNGWVFGSLAIILRDLPQERSSRAFYLNLFKEMANALKKGQRADGAWGPNIADQQEPDMQEMSGTAFFVYGMLWGINNGVLERAEYLPVVQAGWRALCRNINADGRLGWVQPIGDRPVDGYTADDYEVYASGAFLCAAVELRKLIVAQAHPVRRVVTVVNPLELYRAADTVSLELSAVGGASAALRVFDVRNGALVPHQFFDSDGDGSPDLLLFKVSTLARQQREFWIFESSSLPAAPSQTVCFSRHAPDRMDDFLWENDRTAGRIYGPMVAQPPPTGEGLVSSGVDVWNKRVRYPIIDKWLAHKKYHIDHGEGMDNYKVGTDRGCGGFGVFNGGRWYVGKNWATQKHIVNGPVRTLFEVTYAPWECGNGVTVAETRRISLDAGSHLARFESRFKITGATTLIGGAGLDVSKGKQHNGLLTARPDEGWLANCEPELPKQGAISTALVMLQAARLSGDESGNNLYLTATIENEQPLVWYAGSGWSGAGDFVKPEYWQSYVATFAAALRAPLQVRVAVAAH